MKRSSFSFAGEDAEQLVRDWDEDEPQDAGLLYVDVVELEAPAAVVIEGDDL